MGYPRHLFVYLRSFQTIYRIKSVDFSGIRTRIVWIEGKHSDHLTTARISLFRFTLMSYRLDKNQFTCFIKYQTLSMLYFGIQFAFYNSRSRKLRLKRIYKIDHWWKVKDYGLSACQCPSIDQANRSMSKQTVRQVSKWGKLESGM